MFLCAQCTANPGRSDAAFFCSVELGIWQGRYQNALLPWLRWWDSQGNLLLTGEERADRERQRAEQAEFLLEQERLRSQQLAERLTTLGFDPDEISS